MYRYIWRTVNYSFTITEIEHIRLEIMTWKQYFVTRYTSAYDLAKKSPVDPNVHSRVLFARLCNINDRPFYLLQQQYIIYIIMVKKRYSAILSVFVRLHGPMCVFKNNTRSYFHFIAFHTRSARCIAFVSLLLCPFFWQNVSKMNVTTHTLRFQNTFIMLILLVKLYAIKLYTILSLRDTQFQLCSTKFWIIDKLHRSNLTIFYMCVI